MCVTGTDHTPSPPPPLGMWMMSHGHCPKAGVGVGVVLVNVQEWGCFSIFRRADDVTRTMPKGGGCLCMSSPPPSFRKSCTRACIVVHPSKFRPPPTHTHLDGYGPATPVKLLGSAGIGLGSGTSGFDTRVGSGTPGPVPPVWYIPQVWYPNRSGTLEANPCF